MNTQQLIRSEVDRAFRFYTRAVLEVMEEEIPKDSSIYPRLRTKVMNTLGLRGLEAEVKRSISAAFGGEHEQQ